MQNVSQECVMHNKVGRGVTRRLAYIELYTSQTVCHANLSRQFAGAHGLLQFVMTDCPANLSRVCDASLSGESASSVGRASLSRQFSRNTSHHFVTVGLQG